MNKSSLIAMAAIAAVSMSTPMDTTMPPIWKQSKSNRRYRKTGKFGTERRKAWLIKKNQERLGKNSERRMNALL